jgi:acyl-CoA synthetase (NDP forming)
VPTTETLSEEASKALLAPFGLPFALERVARTIDEACASAKSIGFPVVVKVSGDTIAHKTERGLVRLRITDEQSMRQACTELMTLVTEQDGEVSFLVAQMVSGKREFIAGVVTDPQFGRMAVLGIGGVIAEAIDDVALCPLPLAQRDAESMMKALHHQKMLGEFRGDASISVQSVISVLNGLSEACKAHPEIYSIDINPLIADSSGNLIAVDALIEVRTDRETLDHNDAQHDVARSGRHFEALFNPRGVVIVGASSHPGKFGFVSLHNLLANNYEGKIFATNLSGEEVLGITTLPSIDDLPAGEVDLAFFCTPAAANEDLLRQCAQKGISSVFISSAGYRESGDEGARAEERIVALANELDVLIAGPNGQGVVSTPRSLCCQIVAPFPPVGGISVASQSGNFVSSFLNYSRQTGVGIARAVSAGNAAQIRVEDYLDWYSTDNSTKVGLAYIEHVSNGDRLKSAMSKMSSTKPLVVVKGGATSAGSKAASSHTGALASDDKVFDGVCRATGVIRVDDIERAFDVAASFSTQPLPRGNRVVVLTTVGGWGVVTADAIARDGVLDLIELPDDLMIQLGDLLPPRWSRNNPIDCAGGETRDTISQIMDIVAAHDQVDAVIFLGIGIQSNQARLMREGSYYPEFGLERIVQYHNRQDERYAVAALEASRKYSKPVLIATELAVADPNNPGPAMVRETGRLCYPTGARAAYALAQMVRYSEFRSAIQR